MIARPRAAVRVLLAGMLMAALTTTRAAAETYHLIAKADPGVVFIDSESIRVNGGRGVVWSTYFLFDDGDGRFASSGTAFFMTHDELDCTADKSRHLQLESYDAKGRPTAEVTEPTPWTDIIPGSNDALAARLVCDRSFLASDTPFPSEALQMLATVRRARGSFK